MAKEKEETAYAALGVWVPAVALGWLIPAAGIFCLSATAAAPFCWPPSPACFCAA
jgi:hypothetical protein